MSAMVARKITLPGLNAALLAGAAMLSAAWAAPVENRVAVFAALDKITGEITTLKVPVDGVAKFGTFRITPRTCHTRPPTEEPRTMAFVEIDEFTYDRRHRRVFTGWMNAESPGLHAVEHPLFDVWLSGCEQPLKAARAQRGDPVDMTPGSHAEAPAPAGDATAGGKDAPAGPLPPSPGQP